MHTMTLTWNHFSFLFYVSKCRILGIQLETAIQFVSRRTGVASNMNTSISVLCMHVRTYYLCFIIDLVPVVSRQSFLTVSSCHLLKRQDCSVFRFIQSLDAHFAFLFHLVQHLFPFIVYILFFLLLSFWNNKGELTILAKEHLLLYTIEFWNVLLNSTNKIDGMGRPRVENSRIVNELVYAAEKDTAPFCVLYVITNCGNGLWMHVLVFIPSGTVNNDSSPFGFYMMSTTMQNVYWQWAHSTPNKWTVRAINMNRLLLLLMFFWFCNKSMSQSTKIIELPLFNHGWNVIICYQWLIYQKSFPWNWSVSWRLEGNKNQSKWFVTKQIMASD